MNGHVKSLSFFLISILLMIAATDFLLAFAQPSFNAYLGSPIEDSEIDGIIGSEWNDAGKYTNVTINPTGTAEVWIKNDGNYFYIALSFVADSNNSWVAIQLSGGNCMTIDTDGALFGHDEYSSDGYQDILFGEMPAIFLDSVQNGVGAINVDSWNAVTVELKKPLNSGDSAGKDIAWTADDQYAMIIMWDSDNGGSSGGNMNHKAGSSLENTILIDSEAIPEFSTSWALIIIFAIITLAVAFNASRKVRKLSNP